MCLRTTDTLSRELSPGEAVLFAFAALIFSELLLLTLYTQSAAGSDAPAEPVCRLELRLQGSADSGVPFPFITLP